MLNMKIDTKTLAELSGDVEWIRGKVQPGAFEEEIPEVGVWKMCGSVLYNLERFREAPALPVEISLTRETVGEMGITIPDCELAPEILERRDKVYQKLIDLERAAWR